MSRPAFESAIRRALAARDRAQHDRRTSGAEADTQAVAAIMQAAEDWAGSRHAGSRVPVTHYGRSLPACGATGPEKAALATETDVITCGRCRLTSAYRGAIGLV